MKRIKITVGSYGHRPEGSKSVTLITKQHPPVDVSDAEAERLIKLGVAVIVENDIQLTRPEKTPDAGSIPEYSMKNKADELKALMDEFGLPYEDGTTKQQMVDALDAFFDAPAEDDEDAEEVTEQAPDLSAHNPVVE